MVRLFKKHRRPEELGAMLYEALRQALELEGDLSLDGFVESLGRARESLDAQYAGEIMIGMMFGGAMAIERSAPVRVAEQIDAGMKTEFLQHIQEQGASTIQKAEWETIIATRFLDYRQCLEDYSGFEPPWKLGREFFWNILGTDEYDAMSIKISTLYILAARDLCQSLLNEYGPTLIIEKV
ncbi:MAG: hypothetical protein OEM41_01220 [Ignavibacteria bacterium]|nr:hypothetical protein [Ignavibacteria bacterium]